MKCRKAAFFLILLGWLLPALACNLPSPPNPGASQAVPSTSEATGLKTAQAVGAPSLPAVGTPSLQPSPSLPTAPTHPPSQLVWDTFHYYSIPGDTLAAIAGRFGVGQADITGAQQYSPEELIPPESYLLIPNKLGDYETQPVLLPDSEVIYSFTAASFSTEDFVAAQGGFLQTYTEVIDGEKLSGADIVERVARETSTSPRLLLAFLELRSGWVTGKTANPAQLDYPIGFYASDYRGLYKELILVSRQLTLGYYGWRSGKLAEIEFGDGTRMRVDPLLNPGSVAVLNLFAKLYKPAAWREALNNPGRFIPFYMHMFGDPWLRASQAGDLFPAGLTQPELILPFQPGETWTLTGGPHEAWGVGSPWGGLDFAPAAVEKGCTVTRYWATAAAAGLVTRSENGVVAVDLDGDGFEGTGWVLIYLHIAASERISVGTIVSVGDRIGHPSCEGGVATGTHVHISRKYNGEWIPAAGPLPFVLSGWEAQAGLKPYSGRLIKNGQVVTARVDNLRTSLITR